MYQLVTKNPCCSKSLTLARLFGSVIRHILMKSLASRSVTTRFVKSVACKILFLPLSFDNIYSTKRPTAYTSCPSLVVPSDVDSSDMTTSQPENEFSRLHQLLSPIFFVLPKSEIFASNPRSL